MFINIKYMVVTIIAIFLALGIGILIGVQLESQDIIFQQQESLIEKMEQKFDEMSKVNTDLKMDLKNNADIIGRYESYIKNVFPDYIKGKLEGKNVAIMETSDDYSYNFLRQSLRFSGANIISITIESDKIMAMSPEEKDELLDYFSREDISGEIQDINSLIVDIFASALTRNENLEDIYFLQEKGYIDTNGDFSAPADYVVLAGGSREDIKKANIIDIPLIRAFKKSSTPVIGVEAHDVAKSYMEIYKKQKISTVDNIDSIIGQTSMVLIINGAEGNYGIKESATSLMPMIDGEE